MADSEVSRIVGAFFIVLAGFFVLAILGASTVGILEYLVDGGHPWRCVAGIAGWLCIGTLAVYVGSEEG